MNTFALVVSKLCTLENFSTILVDFMLLLEDIPVFLALLAVFFKILLVILKKPSFNNCISTTYLTIHKASK